MKISTASVGRCAVEILRASLSDARRMAHAIKRNVSRLESGVHRFRILGGQGDFHGLFAQLFVDEGQRVIARRQTLDFKLAVWSGYSVERALGYVEEHAHPRVLVALNGQHDFFAGKIFLERGGPGRLGLVPLTIVLGSGMNIVGRGIAVDDLDGLTGDNAKHMRMVLAAALIESDGILGNV